MNNHKDFEGLIEQYYCFFQSNMRPYPNLKNQKWVYVIEK